MDSNWIPNYFKVVSSDENYVNGYVASEEELSSLIEIHRRTFYCDFVYGSDDKKNKEVPDSRRIFWDHQPMGILLKDNNETVMYPYTADHVLKLNCQFGPPHTRNKPCQEQEREHSYQQQKKTHIQYSRKFGCSAKIRVHRLTSLEGQVLDTQKWWSLLIVIEDESSCQLPEGKHVRWASPKTLEKVHHFHSRATIHMRDHGYTSSNSLLGSNTNAVRAMIGPYKIRNRSLLDLQGNLPDELSKRIHHISSCIMTAIMERLEDIHGFQRKVDYSQFDMIWGAYNEDECHWTLLVAYPSERKLLYINPSGELSARKRKVIESWSHFMSKRSRMCSTGPRGDWTLQITQHNKQTDLTSCGVYVLKFAEYLAKDIPLTTLHQYHIPDARQEIENALLENSDPLELLCHSCDAVLDEDGTCSSCAGQPTQIPASTNLGSNASTSSSTSSQSGSKSGQGGMKRLRLSKKNKPRPETNISPVNKNQGDEESVPAKDRNTAGESSTEGQNSAKGEDDSLMEFCRSNIDAAINLVYDIMECSDNCTETDHYRHHEFLHNYHMVCRREKKKYGFGYEVFGEQCVEWVTNRVKDDLLKRFRDPDHPFTNTGFQIKNLTDCALAKIFGENHMLAQDYILYVAVKEVLVLLRTIHQGCPYETANDLCEQSEVDMTKRARK